MRNATWLVFVVLSFGLTNCVHSGSTDKSTLATDASDGGLSYPQAISCLARVAPKAALLRGSRGFAAVAMGQTDAEGQIISYRLATKSGVYHLQAPRSGSTDTVYMDLVMGSGSDQTKTSVSLRNFMGVRNYLEQAEKKVPRTGRFQEVRLKSLPWSMVSDDVISKYQDSYKTLNERMSLTRMQVTAPAKTPEAKTGRQRARSAYIRLRKQMDRHEKYCSALIPRESAVQLSKEGN